MVLASMPELAARLRGLGGKGRTGCSDILSMIKPQSAQFGVILRPYLPPCTLKVASSQGSWPWAVSRVPGPPSPTFQRTRVSWLRELSSWTRRQWWGHRWGCHSLALTLQLYPAMRAWARTSHLLSRGEITQGVLPGSINVPRKGPRRRLGYRLPLLPVTLKCSGKGGEKSNFIFEIAHHCSHSSW